MGDVEQFLSEAREFLHDKIPFLPKVCIILGTGLSSLAERIAIKARIPYGEIPHFPLSTVETHTGNVLFGCWGGREIAVLQGRVHYYEGYSLQEVTFPVRVMARLGLSTLIITNAAGGLNPEFSPGEMMVITDHISLMGDNPLRGSNVESLGSRFPSMHEAYSGQLAAEILRAADEGEIPLRQGVYAGVPGPSLETPAEIKFLRMIGADAVGMSTVPEVIAAVHAGISVLGISVISNVSVPGSFSPASLEEVVANVRKALPDLAFLLERFLSRLAKE